MGQRPCTFKKRDVKTALQAAHECGLEVERVEIDKDGKIVIVAGKPTENGVAADTNRSAGANEWDSIQ
jgi:hypothetical protein